MPNLRPTTIFPITTRSLRVLRATDVTPGMRRITLGGDQLAAHIAENGFAVAEFRSEGFDDEFKLILPGEDGELLIPTQNDGQLDWATGAFANTRTYTVRRWDPEAGEIDIDVVKHGNGVATTWARTCRPGDEINIAGPKMSSGHPPAEWVLIGGDETALPAIARCLEEMPAGTRAEVYIEIADASHRQPLPTKAEATVTWLERDGAPAGTTTALFDAIRSGPWHSDDVFAWVAGEAITLTPIRRWLRGDRNLPKDRVEVTGYWRRAGQDVDGADEVEAPEHDPREYLHELVELAPGLAVRAAVTTGVIERLAVAPASVDALAHDLDLNPGATLRLLRYLRPLDIVETEANLWRLTSTGGLLADDGTAEGLNLDGIEGRAVIALVGLPESLRTGSAAYRHVYGDTFDDVIGLRGLEKQRLRHPLAEWTADPLSRSGLIEGVTDLRIQGLGVLDAAFALQRTRPHLWLRILVTPAQVEAAEAAPWPDPNRVTIEVGGVLDPRPERSEAFLLLDTLTALPDADAVHVLRQASASTIDGSVLLLDDPVDDTSSDHELEEDLIALTSTGGCRRRAEETDALAGQAGLRLDSRETLGWGSPLRRYVPAP